MPEYIIECRGDCREVYYVLADSEDEAREMFETGKLGPADVTECSTDIVAIEEDASLPR